MSLWIISLALAWESECRTEADAAQFGGRNNNPQMSICADAATPQCDPGPPAAHGVHMGEHTWVARQGLSLAGLSGLTGRTFLEYYGGTGTFTLPDGTQLPRWAPVEDQLATTHIQRPTVLGEVANLPDYSHSLSDFVLANEHCTVANMPRGTDQATVDCHTFAPHMSSINSTHFGSQARQAYLDHHETAVYLATECAVLHQRLVDSGDPIALEFAVELARDCENEALAFELFGSHFLADAWSSGHMWERWGRPTVPTTPQARLNHATVGVVSGIIHGWRSVVRALPTAQQLLVHEHDAMCMPGPFGDDEDPTRLVEWREPNGEPAAAGGDLYLLECTAVDEAPEGAVSTGPRMEAQYDRMRACIAAGVGEVYDAGPRTLGDRVPAQNPDPSITSSTQPACFGARVTNASFVEGMRLGQSGTTLADPRRMARLKLGFAVNAVQDPLTELGVTDDDRETTDRHLRSQLSTLAAVANLRAKADPDGTDLANLTLPGTTSLLGFQRNQSYVNGLAFSPRPAYFDSRPNTWWAGAGVACATDADCPDGNFCDATDPSQPVCHSAETALIRAFRTAHIEEGCGNTSSSELDVLRENCVTYGGVECDVCTDAIFPKLRNGCDSGSHSILQADGPENHASMCDVLEAYQSAAVYGLYEAGDPAAARAEARAICETSPAERPLDPEPFWWVPRVDVDYVELSPTHTGVEIAVDSAGPYQGDLEWTAYSDDPTVSVSNTSWSNRGGDALVQVVSTTDTTTSRLEQIEFSNTCAPSFRGGTQLVVDGGDVQLVDFEEVVPIEQNVYDAPGVSFTSFQGSLYRVVGDDAIGEGALCASPALFSYCAHDVVLTFSPPVSAVSLYVGDQDIDFEGVWSLAVDGSAPLVSRQDRRFYSISGESIETVVFTPSDEYELIDEVRFIPE